MLVSFYSTLLEYTVKTRQSVAGLFNKSSFRNWALITLIACLISVNIFAIFNTRSVNAADGYVLDRVIQWADGSTEHVQIDSDYFFILDGQKKKLVGMVLSSFGLPELVWFTKLCINSSFLVPRRLQDASDLLAGLQRLVLTLYV